ncbi:MAG: TRAP transporter large permease, partial [Betaproteobacteria bacterium]
GFAIGIAAWGYVLIAGVPQLVLAQQIANGPDSWILLAMPLFVLAGLLMNETGISTRIIAFAQALVGHLRGGLAMVLVVAAMFFGGISGSAVADATALGSVLIPAMTKRGYPKAFSAALTSSSGSIGIIIPPSIPMIIYGAITGVSVSAMFVAGILPGILMGLSQMILIYFLARKYGWGGISSFNLKQIGITARASGLGLMMPVIIMGGILGGVFTPTEAGAVAVVYGIAVSIFFYHTLTWARLYRTLIDGAIITSIVMIMVSASFAFGWVMTFEGVPQQVSTWFLALHVGRDVFLVMVCLLLIGLGCIMHGDPMMLLTVPILFPAAKALGVDGIHFGILVVLCVAIGQQTPPVGSTLFVVSALSGKDIFAITRANLLFITAMVLLLVLVLFVPGIVTSVVALLRTAG